MDKVKVANVSGDYARLRVVIGPQAAGWQADLATGSLATAT